jgi:hypothetical protein
MHTTIRHATLLALLIVVPAAATAQEEATARWGAEIGFTLNTSGGNEDLTVLATDIGITHLDSAQYELDAGAHLRYGQSEGKDVAQNLRGNVSVDVWPRATWSPFVFADAESDPFKRLDLRLNAGAGVKHTFHQDGWDEVSLSGAVLYSRESLEVPDTLGDGVTRTARWSWRGRGRFELGEGRRIEQLVFYQPAWNELEDYLLYVVTSGRWAISSHLAFTTVIRYDRDSTPAPEVEADDWSVAVGLSLATRW